jgi:hypothetical protein
MCGIFQSSTKSYGRPANARTADAHLRDRQEKASAAKAGVRRRRGPRMQVNLQSLFRPQLF